MDKFPLKGKLREANLGWRLVRPGMPSIPALAAVQQGLAGNDPFGNNPDRPLGCREKGRIDEVSYG
jgi:hypothetical protein